MYKFAQSAEVFGGITVPFGIFNDLLKPFPFIGFQIFPPSRAGIQELWDQGSTCYVPQRIAVDSMIADGLYGMKMLTGRFVGQIAPFWVWKPMPHLNDVADAVGRHSTLSYELWKQTRAIQCHSEQLLSRYLPFLCWWSTYLTNFSGKYLWSRAVNVSKFYAVLCFCAYVQH